MATTSTQVDLLVAKEASHFSVPLILLLFLYLECAILKEAP